MPLAILADGIFILKQKSAEYASFSCFFSFLYYKKNIIQLNLMA